jgi:hypothetical protein
MAWVPIVFGGEPRPWAYMDRPGPRQHGGRLLCRVTVRDFPNKASYLNVNFEQVYSIAENSDHYHDWLTVVVS